jgi:hypothetical protein
MWSARIWKGASKDCAIDRIDAWFLGLFALSASYAAIAALIGAVGALTSMLQS